MPRFRDFEKNDDVKTFEKFSRKRPNKEGEENRKKQFKKIKK